MEQKKCKKCLIQDMSDIDLKEKIKRTVDGIQGDIKASSTLYKKRLEICKMCDKLLNGMCLSCGCFMEVRAAIKEQYCPSVDKKW